MCHDRSNVVYYRNAEELKKYQPLINLNILEIEVAGIVPRYMNIIYSN